MKLEQFPQSHPLLGQDSDQEEFREKLLTWHRQLQQLHRDIHKDFDVVWAETTISSNLILALYIVRN